jgi:sec-independent protein translocase protein TatA
MMRLAPPTPYNGCVPGRFACVGSIGAPEILVVFLVALIVLGPDRLPKAAKQLGRAVSEFRRVTSGFQDEVKRAIDYEGSDSKSSDASPPARPRPSAAPGSPTVDLPPPPDDPSR